MPTPTTIKLPDALRRRVKRAAREADLSVHAFLVAAIARQTEVAEARRAMAEDAAAAEAAFEDSGRYATLDDVAAWLEERVAGKPARRPRVRTWPGSSSPRER